MKTKKEQRKEIKRKVRSIVWNSLVMPVLKTLPSSVRHKLYRSRVKLSPDTFSSKFSVEIASSKADLEQAFKILHDSYVKINIMNPHRMGWRCDKFSLSPHTTTIVVKDRGIVVGTVALIRDSSLGLPCDKEYKQQNDELRAGHKCLTEVSALALAEGYRDPHHCVSLLLMKYLHNFCKNHLQSDYLVCAVHPRAQDFYEALFGFKRNGPLVCYQNAKGALAIHMSFEFSEQNAQKLLHSYKSLSPSENLIAFMLQDDNRMKYPASTPERCIYPVLTQELSSHYQNVMNISIDSSRELRVPIQLNVRIRNGETILPARIRDISSEGCYLEIADDLVDQLKDFEIRFTFQNRLYTIPVTTTWKNKNSVLRYSSGVGVRFNSEMVDLKGDLMDWMNWNDTSARVAQVKSVPNMAA